MTKLVSQSEVDPAPAATRGWRSIAAVLKRPASMTGLRCGLALILVPSLILVGVEIYSAGRIVPALQQSQAQVAHSLQVIAAAHALDR